jgi:predicted O-methyltransferase YrrM
MLLKIIKALPRALRSPITAAQLARKRLLPFGLIPKDRQSYRIASWNCGSLPRLPVTDVLPDIQKLDVEILNVFDRTADLSLDPNELLILLALVKTVRAATILEVGTWDGNTALNLAANIDNNGKVYTVDLPPDSSGEVALNIPSILNNTTDRSQLGVQYKQSPLSAKIHQIYSDSATLDWKGLGVSFDLIFIDGCHAYNYVRSDTCNALLVLKTGGTLVWHDYGMIADVSRFVDKVAKYAPVKVISGTRLAVMLQKPEGFSVSHIE